MKPAKCIRCHREIFFSRDDKTRRLQAFEKIEPFQMTIESDGWVAKEVETSDHRALYVAHQKYCVKKEITKEMPCPI